MKPKLETVGQIKKGCTFLAYEDTTAFTIAEDLTHTHWTVMPVVDQGNRVIGMVSEQDLLRALRSPRALEEIKVKEIMTGPPILIKEETTLEEASKIMEGAQIHRLPVVKDGVLAGTVTRRDLVRGWLGMSIE